jgi:hypothetical protein
MEASDGTLYAPKPGQTNGKTTGKTNGAEKDTDRAVKEMATREMATSA